MTPEACRAKWSSKLTSEWQSGRELGICANNYHHQTGLVRLIEEGVAETSFQWKKTRTCNMKVRCWRLKPCV